jgi:parvulin-like peptidyl-prolyl isomerase
MTLLLVSGCDGERGGEKERRVVARVNGTPIFLDDFLREYRRMRLDDEEGEEPSLATSQAQKMALVDNLVERRLLSEEAEDHHVVVSIEEVDALYQRTRSGWDEVEIDELLRTKDLTPAELKRELRDLLLIRKYLRDHLYARIPVTDEEISGYIDAHPETQLLPEAVHALQIVVKTEEKANEILQEIKKGTSFQAAAMKFSLSPEAKNGGDLGFFPRGSMPSIFDEVCFNLKPGEVSRVVASDYGFHLFKVVEKRPEALKPVAQTRHEVEQVLRREKERAAHDAKVAELRQKTEIIIYDKELARVL